LRVFARSKAKRIDRELLDPAAVQIPPRRRVQAFRVLADDHEVHLPRLPDLLEPVVDLVAHVRVELRRADVRVEVEAEAEAEEDADPREVAVRQDRLGQANGPEENRVRGLARLVRAVRPLRSGVEVALAARGIGHAVERQAEGVLHGRQDLHGLPHDLGARAVSREEDDLVRHRAAESAGPHKDSRGATRMSRKASSSLTLNEVNTQSAAT